MTVDSDLILHIGGPKCGSTTIQRLLLGLNQDLIAAGVVPIGAFQNSYATGQSAALNARRSVARAIKLLPISTLETPPR